MGAHAIPGAEQRWDCVREGSCAWGRAERTSTFDNLRFCYGRRLAPIVPAPPLKSRTRRALGPRIAPQALPHTPSRSGNQYQSKTPASAPFSPAPGPHWPRGCPGDDGAAEPTVCVPLLCCRAEQCKPPVPLPVRRPDNPETDRVVAPEPTALTPAFFFANVELLWEAGRGELVWIFWSTSLVMFVLGRFLDNMFETHFRKMGKVDGKKHSHKIPLAKEVG